MSESGSPNCGQGSKGRYYIAAGGIWKMMQGRVGEGCQPVIATEESGREREW